MGSLGKLPNELDVRGVIVRNCTLTGTTNGVRIKTFPASDPSRASGIVFGNIVMNNVVNPVIIDQSYGGRPTDQVSLKFTVNGIIIGLSKLQWVTFNLNLEKSCVKYTFS